MLRLFIASDLPEAAKRALGSTSARLRQELPPASWGRPETYHVTYAFLGDQDDAVVAHLGDALAASLAGSDAFDATIGGGGFFPDERRPRVAWVGLSPAERFSRVAAVVRDAVRAAGVSMDEKPFAPHMTIARVKVPWKRHDTERFVAAFGAAATPARIDAVTLYVSRLASGGAVHTPLRIVRLS